MSNGQLDPAVLVSATIRSNPKILRLSVEEKWAFIVLLCEAKLRRPPGQFEDRAVLDYKMAELAPCVDAMFTRGSLHLAPTRCTGCRTWFGQVERGTILVHDWHLQQGRSTARVRAFREKHGLTNGRQRRPEHDPDPSESATRDIAPALPSGFPATLLAPTRDARRSRSHSQDVAPEGVQGEPADDPLPEVERWLASHRMGAQPGSSTYTTLARLADQHGAPRVIEAFEALLVEHPEMRDAPQFVFGARKYLNPIPDVHGPGHPAVKGAAGSEDLQRAVERV